MAKIRSLWLEQQQKQQQASSSRQVLDHHLFADQPQRSPLPDQIIEPEPEAEAEPLAVSLVVSDDDHHQKTLKISGDDDDLEYLRPIKILRLFGVNIPIYHFHIDDDDDDAASTQTQAMITFHERLGLNPNIDHQQVEEEHEDEYEEEVPPGAAVLQFDPRRLMVEGVEQDPVMLFTKTLTYSDVVGQHNRLLITKTKSQMLLAALTEQEKREAVDMKEDYLRVAATAFNGIGRDDQQEFILHLTKWLSSGSIVLKHQWIDLVRANNLQQGDSVQAWGYRLRGRFRLAFNIIKN